MGDVVVIGVGRTDRGDDGAGLAVAAGCASAHPPGVRVISGGEDPATLIEAWSGARLAVLVDAMHSGREAGTVERIDVTTHPLPATLGFPSTHGTGPAPAIELARMLGRMPQRLVVYGVEAGSVMPGGGLSPPVAAACDLVVGMVLEELADA